MKLTCNFAIARFRPYRETGEFANVGIVLLCPQVGFFNYIFETRKHKRITDFFPELDFEVFKAGMSGMLKELRRLAHDEEKTPHQYVIQEVAGAQIAAFKELVRMREALFHFGDVGTVLTNDPQAKLDELFKYYIERQFARDREYQEIIMRRKLSDFLQKNNLSRFYKQDQPIGDDTYRIILPFVNFDGTKARKAIKPLHLDKEAPTDIYRHGDAWVSTVKRLRRIKLLPKEFLFAIKRPVGSGKRESAAVEICNELESLDTETVSFSDTDAILKFAMRGN